MVDSNTAAPKRAMKFPHVFSFLFSTVLVVLILTWVIPAGQFEREVKVVAGIKQSQVVAGTYHQVEPAPQAVWKIFSALDTGFTQSGGMIFMVFFCGAAIYILEKTGTVRVSFQRILKKVRGREHVAVFVVMLFMSIGGATGAFANTALALVPLGILFARALGFDNAVGFCLVYLGSYAGFNVGWGNLFTIGIAQDIAELEKFSGFYVRILFHVVNLLLTYWWVSRYIVRIKKDPLSSLLYEEGVNPSDLYGSEESFDEYEPFTWRHKACIAIAALGLGSIIVGSLQWNWGIPLYSATFLAMAIFTGLLGGLGVDGTCKEFIKGSATMVAGAFVIGISRAIAVIMTDGKIIDSIVYYLSQPIASYGPVLGANIMFYVNLLLNFFIPSGSGQAVAVMPLMVPIADLAQITRQVAVQAFQFGDGLSNCVIPTSGVLLSALSLANVPYARYLKWFAPLFVIQVILASAAITVLQYIGW
ncbi:MAG: hypothetical protein LBQ42_09650 [Synergistaceae bacterium]|jgi:uncharacterized ion transporter superfamily protein YfcC|nr:hypothetical protein [Synergistaceae bacterium]